VKSGKDYKGRVGVKVVVIRIIEREKREHFTNINNTTTYFTLTRWGGGKESIVKSGLKECILL
jgi:hypothetical protein